MTGLKLNENVLALDEGQRSTKATARFVRGSASKARVVLDLVRGLDVQRADEVLRFSDRAAAAEVRKVLASAIANAAHNDHQDPEELYVVACFADEGPTLKRFRPRARGRASRIRKRTCHITVIVAPMSAERLEIVQGRQEASGVGRRPGLSAQARAERVARSRQRAEALREGGEPADGDEVDAADDELTDEVADDAVTADEAPADEAPDTAEAPADEAVDEQDGAADIDMPAGAVAAPEDGSVPEGYPIKGNASSMKYHEPGGAYYDITIAEVYFDTPESAEAAGYEAVGGARAGDDETDGEEQS